MSDRLDELLARLAAAPVDLELDGLELGVGRAIRLRRRSARQSEALAPVGFASLALALAIGITAGGATAAAAMVAPQHYGTFSSGAHLAPSTLLEGNR